MSEIKGPPLSQKLAVLKVANYKPFKIVPYREIQRGSVHPDDEG